MPRAAPSQDRELRTLSAIAEALATAPDVQQALERTLSLVAELLGLRTGWVWLLNPDTGQFYLAAALELPPYLQEPVRMASRTCRCHDDFRAGNLTPTNFNVLECSRLWSAAQAGDLIATQGLRFHASVPLVFRGESLGVLNVAGPEWREITPNELRLLSTIGYHVGTAIARARLEEERAGLVRAEERTRIARDMHDTLAQGLTAIGLNIESALHRLETNPTQARERLERALRLTRNSLEEARRTVHDLRASPLEGRSLSEALHRLARSFTSETGVQVHVQLPNALSLDAPTEAELFRIAQEALTNIARHAQATAVSISILIKGDALNLRIRDNGKGFAPSEASGQSHGMQGMRERARLLGGRLRLTSRAGRGTVVHVCAPLSKEKTA